MHSVCIVVLAVLAACGCAAVRVDRQVMEQRHAESRIHALSAQLDSLTLENDSLRAGATRLETELRDREEQIQALRLELQRLKEIDLRPRTRKPVT
jgi:cell division protein FtsB